MRSSLLACALVACTTPHPAPGDDTPPGDTPDAADPGPDFCNATDPRDTPVDVVADPEAGEKPFVDALDTATTSIRVEIYEMGFGGILDRLIAKAQAGVTVRVILDQSKKDVNQKYFDQLAAAGAETKWSDPKFTFQHAKFIVVDDTIAVITTGNFSKKYSIDLERNFVATDRDHADIVDLRALFDADWTGAQPTLSCTRLLVSPVNSRQRILDLIASAQSTLTIESMQFADTQVRAAVKARVEAGVAVRVILAEASWITANAGAATFLTGLGVTVKSIPHCHTKVIVADGVHAYLGSENLSLTSLDHNREVGLVVNEEASIAPLEATFESDWATGAAF